MAVVKTIVAYRFSRFLIIGLCNTALNFAVLNFAFYSLHTSKLVSSFIATSCAVIFSFLLNRSFVFIDKERPAEKFLLFLTVTASGALIVQNSVYALCVLLFSHREAGIINLVHAVTGIRLAADFIDVNLSNAVASLSVMLWNYNGYRLFVFNGKRDGDKIIEENV